MTSTWISGSLVGLFLFSGLSLGPIFFCAPSFLIECHALCMKTLNFCLSTDRIMADYFNSVRDWTD